MYHLKNSKSITGLNGSFTNMMTLGIRVDFFYLLLLDCESIDHSGDRDNLVV